ncbi:uncharacterized protein LOC130786427 [Actinidia eriantha]|uniref:uncharacterized protein LOC130786427 n=1 Tax=Actinidia eriantha TaxID=165200 RepID=UPI00258AA81C|nr:uncharacterized protein LOC130786427 [Actinidia eriantha]
MNTSTRPTFTIEGFRSWKRVSDGNRCALLNHVGCANSPHNNAIKSVEGLSNVAQHIDKVINAQSLEEIRKNRLCLRTTIESVRWLSLQACALRGHDESLDSNNPGNLIAMIKLMGKLNVDIDDVVLEKAPKNAKYTSPIIQKEILHILTNKVRNIILEEIGDAKFCILIDEAKDAANREQMAIKEISNVLARYNMNIENMRGQGYDGASNMRGAWNGLQALFLKDCPYAYYIHCLAHRLQLALVAAAENNISVWLFFSKLACIINLVSASPKRQNELQCTQVAEVEHMLDIGERETGRGANQIGTLHRAGTTRWSSHFSSICSLIDLYGTTIKAGGALIEVRSFDFIFILHLMHRIMRITDLLCRALQHKSLDILNAMDLVSTTKVLLQTLRQDGFNTLLMHVSSVCTQYDIEMPMMDARYKEVTGRSCQQRDHITMDHHYCVDIFNAVIDFQLEELNNRFSEGAMELLILSSALESKDGFKSLDIDKICTLAEKFYLCDFTNQKMYYLRCQLEHYKLDVPQHEKFQNMSKIFELCQCISTTSYSISINGSMHGFFKGYQDDLILFSRGDVDSVQLMLNKLRTFGDCSGLKISMQKSNILLQESQGKTLRVSSLYQVLLWAGFLSGDRCCGFYSENLVMCCGLSPVPISIAVDTSCCRADMGMKLSGAGGFGCYLPEGAPNFHPMLVRLGSS